ncbi:unnamed protein product [Prunus armeniaca]
MDDDDDDATPKLESSPSQPQLPTSQKSSVQKMLWADYQDNQDPYDLAPTIRFPQQSSSKVKVKVERLWPHL